MYRQSSSYAYFQENRLVKREQEGLEQDRGDWSSQHCGHLHRQWPSVSHFVLPCLPESSSGCEGVIGGASTKLVSSFMGSGPPSQGVTGADLKSTHLAAGTTAEVMQLSRFRL